MSITRSSGALIGTDETTLQAVAAAATFSGAEVDVLGGDNAVGDAELYAVVTAIAVSTVDIQINPRRVSGQDYKRDFFNFQVDTINGTKRIPLGRVIPSRYLQVDVRNNDATNGISVFIGYELFKVV